MRLNRTLRTTASGAVLGAALLGGGAAMAQDGQVTTVDEIIVTAQLREQSLQEVPVVVTTLSEEALANAGVRDIKDVQVLTPGLTVTSTSSEASTTARIRGVGTVGDNPGLESSVGIVIDGVYRSRNGVGFGDLGELERIEVLKGPQGTLFGKNTSAGVINVITQLPSFTPEYNLELTAGNYGALGAAGSVSGPITENLAMRLFAARRVRDGFYEVNTGDGPRTLTDDNNQDYWTTRGQLLFLPNDNTSIRLIADYSKREEYCCTGVSIRTGPTFGIIDSLSNGTGTRPPATGFGELPFSREAFANRGSDQEMTDRGVSAEVNIDIPSMNARLTSITSWRDWETVNAQDIDYTGADILYREKDGQFGYTVENLTQEIRLAGTSDRLDWLVGLFATTESIDRADSYYYGADYTPFISLLLTNGASPAFVGCLSRPGQTAATLGACAATGGAVNGGGPGFGTGLGVVDNYTQDTTSFAVFTNNTFRLTDQFDVTFGLRYTQDSKELTGRQDNVGTNGQACGATLGNQAAIGAVLGAAAARAIGVVCLPWANPLYDNRTIDEDFDDSEVTGTIKATYRLNDDLMVYGSYARGYKSYGYNMDRVQNGVVPNASLFFPSEVVDSYELGFKSTLLDGSLLFNATYFNQAFEDFQLNTFLGTAFVVESIPELTSEGVDLDLLWFTPIEGLTLSGGLTYAQTEYGEFTAADLAVPGNFAGLSLLPGATASFAPEWSGSGSINYERSLGNGLQLGLSLSGKYMTEYNTGSDLLPFKQQDGYGLFNGRISIGAESERWTVDLWAQNLTDEEYYQVVYNSSLQGSAFASTVQPDGSFYNPATDTQGYSAFLGAPRTWGVTLRLSY